MPSRRDPGTGPCDAYSTNSCCMAKLNITGDQLTPWDQDLIMPLRGPMRVAQLAVYQPSASSSMPATDWVLRGRWDAQAKTGIAFDGKATSAGDFAGTVGSQCLVNVSTDQPFPCGAASQPYCPSGSGKYFGWAGEKMFVVLASMPHAGTDALPASQSCSTDTSNGWYDAPWIGLSHGELLRAGANQACQCYDKMPGSLKGAGCGAATDGRRGDAAAAAALTGGYLTTRQVALQAAPQLPFSGPRSHSSAPAVSTTPSPQWGPSLQFVVQPP